MTDKEKAIAVISELPDEATWEDIQEKINLLAGLEKAENQLNHGEGIPHEQFKKDLKAWI